MYKQIGESTYNTAKGQATTIVEMTSKINDLEQKMKAIEKEEEILSRELADRERLLNESLEQHVEEKTNLEETISAQKKNIDGLKEIISDLMQSDLKNNITLEQLAELEKSRQTITDLEGELQFTNDALQQRDVIFEENYKSQQVIKILQDTIYSLEQNPKITEAQADELNYLRNKIKSLEDELTITKENKEEYREEEKTEKLNHIEKQQEVIKQLQETISSLERKSKVTQEQFDEINIIKNKVKALTEELTYLNNELENRDSIIVNYENKGASGEETISEDMQPTTEISRGLSEFVVRIKYPVSGSDEHIINVIGDNGTSTEANLMNISREINNPDDSPAENEDPPSYTSEGGKGNSNKRRKHKGFFSSEEFIKF